MAAGSGGSQLTVPPRIGHPGRAGAERAGGRGKHSIARAALACIADGHCGRRDGRRPAGCNRCAPGC